MNTDSREYHILENAAKSIKSIDGMTCEIGVREGGGSQIILDALRNTNQSKVHIAIDPFGNIDYEHWETRKDKVDYTNKMKNNMLKNMYTYCSKYNMEVLFFPLEDTEFFKKYADGVPVYNDYKQVLNSYALVFFDGPHTSKLVRDEFDFFKNKVPIGGMLIFDDIDQYPHMTALDEYIQSFNFKMVDKGVCKISYVKY